MHRVNFHSTLFDDLSSTKPSNATISMPVNELAGKSASL